MRAFIYARQSLDRNATELAIARQLKECKRVATQRGWAVADVIVDNNVSASKAGRKGYKQLLERLERHEADLVVVLRIDRLLRLNDELEELINLAERTGVTVATVEGDINLQTPQGRLVARVLVSVARSEMELKSERHKLANAQKAASGKPHGGRRPYGYQSDMVTIKEDEAAVLHEMARRVIAGHSTKEVAYWLNEHGHTTSTGRQFYSLTVRNMLMKKRYAGIREYGGTDYPATWPAVFDPDTWQALQLTLKLRREQSPDRPIARKYLLTGFVYCGKCGKPLNGATKRDHPGRPLRRTYHCRVQGDTQRQGGCGGVVRNADALEHFVAECLLYRLDTPLLSQLLEDSGRDTAALRQLMAQQDAQRLRIDGLVDDYATGLLSRTQLARAKQSAQAELERITAEIRQHTASTSSVRFLPLGQTLRQAWVQSESDEWRRAIIGLVIDRIVLKPGLTKPFYEVDGKVMRFDPSLVDIHWLH